MNKFNVFIKKIVVIQMIVVVMIIDFIIFILNKVLILK